MKTNSIKIIFLSLTIQVCYWVLNLVIGNSNDFHLNIWSLISSFLVIITLYLLKQNIITDDKKAFFSLFIVYFMVGHFNILIEAYVFNVLDFPTTLKEILRGFLMSLIVSYLVVKMLAYENIYQPKEPNNRTLLSWLGRVLLIIILYILFYILAGMLVQGTIAEFMDFYEDKIPPINVILLTQVFRGLIFALIVIFLSQITNTSKLKGALLTGLTFSILGAIAPLITPNEHMPQYIRVIHSFEVGISNFIFGAIAFFLIGFTKIDKGIKSPMH